MKPFRVFRFAVVALVQMTFPREAGAFCQAAVCAEGECAKDEDGCSVGGLPVVWWKGCVSFAVHAEASELRGLSADDLELAVLEASEAWRDASCESGGPNVELFTAGQVECGLVEFNLSGKNENIWMFRDFDWPYGDDGHAAYTTLSYDTRTGELLDADVEINTAQINITKDPEEGGFDLHSVVLHEMGHFLGLDHSEAEDAVMSPTLAPNSPRHQLRPDDEAGLCALYGDLPEEVSCEPFGGFSSLCGADQDEEPPSDEEAPEEGASASSPSGPGGCAFSSRGPFAGAAAFLRAISWAPWLLLWCLLRRRRWARREPRLRHRRPVYRWLKSRLPRWRARESPSGPTPKTSGA